MKQFRQFLGIESHNLPVKEILVAVVSGGLAILILYLAGSFWAEQFNNYKNCFVLLPIGATAVLVFAVPHGALSQPWNVIAGNFISALVGIASAQIFKDEALAAAVALAIAILLMQVFHCIHPPGGATALTAVLGGSHIEQLGYAYAFFPVLTSALMIVVLAVALNYPFSWRRYPIHLLYIHRKKVQKNAAEITANDMLLAVEAHGSYLDIGEETWQELLEIAKQIKDQAD
ncbi:HPP family protein [Gayadomonas joobiniege]|uniref:HPP family protein n=1 Tax=Gayadomonas joobiniege TaxID=1234606 RepID=UPI00037A7386|nr:HPP family protein [Gayadomonas joobiniege]